MLWNRSHNPIDASTWLLWARLSGQQVAWKGFHGSLLGSLEELAKADGSPYLVYTPFWKNFLTKYEERILPKVRKLPSFPKTAAELGCGIDDLQLLPNTPWYKGFSEHWTPGEEAALARLKSFLKHPVREYGSKRDQPHEKGTSMLSPHLHFGELHPHRVLSLVCQSYGPLEQIQKPDVVQFCKEILWREFSYHLLQHFPKTPSQPLRPAFKDFPWRKNSRLFKAWSRGQTGYPIVDAGMRQLANRLDA